MSKYDYSFKHAAWEKKKLSPYSAKTEENSRPLQEFVRNSQADCLWFNIQI